MFIKHLILFFLLSGIFSQCLNKLASEKKDCVTLDVTQNDIDNAYSGKSSLKPSNETKNYSCCYIKVQFVGQEEEKKFCHIFFNEDVKKTNIDYTISRIGSGKYHFWSDKADVSKLECGEKKRKFNILVNVFCLLGMILV